MTLTDYLNTLGVFGCCVDAARLACPGREFAATCPPSIRSPLTNDILADLPVFGSEKM